MNSQLRQKVPLKGSIVQSSQHFFPLFNQRNPITGQQIPPHKNPETTSRYSIPKKTIKPKPVEVDLCEIFKLKPGQTNEHPTSTSTRGSKDNQHLKPKISEYEFKLYSKKMSEFLTHRPDNQAIRSGPRMEFVHINRLKTDHSEHLKVETFRSSVGKKLTVLFPQNQEINQRKSTSIFELKNKQIENKENINSVIFSRQTKITIFNKPVDENKAKKSYITAQEGSRVVTQPDKPRKQTASEYQPILPDSPRIDQAYHYLKKMLWNMDAKDNLRNINKLNPASCLFSLPVQSKRYLLGQMAINLERLKIKERGLYFAFAIFECCVNELKPNPIPHPSLVAETALYMATKWEDLHPFHLKRFLTAGEMTSEPSEVIALETAILTAVNYEMIWVLIYDYFEIFSSLAQFDNKLRSYGLFLLALSTVNPIINSSGKRLAAFTLCYLLTHLFRTTVFWQKTEIKGERYFGVKIQGQVFEKQRANDSPTADRTLFDYIFAEKEVKNMAKEFLEDVLKTKKDDCPGVYKLFGTQKYEQVSKFTILHGVKAI